MEGRSAAGRRSVWGCGQFRAVWAAAALSQTGDELTRVALTVLVFAQTGSALGAAGAYAVTLLPLLVGGGLLAGWADRYPRRSVMVGCDLAAAALTAAAAIGGLPLPVLFVLVFCVGLLAGPFDICRTAVVRQLFDDDQRFTAAVTVRALSWRGCQVLGFAAGGLLVAGLGARPALLLDATTYLASAVIVRLWVARRPAAAAGRARSGYVTESVAGARLVFGDPQLRTLVLYGWLAGFHIVPAAVVAPYVARHGGGPAAVGLLLAAPTAGTALSVLILTVGVRGIQRRVRLIGPLSVLAAAPLIGCAANPPLPLTGLIWAVAGAGIGYHFASNVAFTTAVPDDRRGQALGVASIGLLTSQTGALLLAGALARTIDPALIIAGAGALGTLAALALTATTGHHLTPAPA